MSQPKHPLRIESMLAVDDSLARPLEGRERETRCFSRDYNWQIFTSMYPVLTMLLQYCCPRNKEVANPECARFGAHTEDAVLS